MGTGHQKDQVLIRSLELPAALPTSVEGRGAGDGAHSQSWLCNETSVKTPKLWGLGRFAVSEGASEFLAGVVNVF